MRNLFAHCKSLSRNHEGIGEVHKIQYKQKQRTGGTLDGLHAAGGAVVAERAGGGALRARQPGGHPVAPRGAGQLLGGVARAVVALGAQP